MDFYFTDVCAVVAYSRKAVSWVLESTHVILIHKRRERREIEKCNAKYTYIESLVSLCEV